MSLEIVTGCVMTNVLKAGHNGICSILKARYGVGRVYAGMIGKVLK